MTHLWVIYEITLQFLWSHVCYRSCKLLIEVSGVSRATTCVCCHLPLPIGTVRQSNMICCCLTCMSWHTHYPAARVEAPRFTFALVSLLSELCSWVWEAERSQPSAADNVINKTKKAFLGAFVTAVTSTLTVLLKIMWVYDNCVSVYVKQYLTI